MSYEIEDEYIIWMILDYLEVRGLHESLSSLYLETNTCKDKSHNDILYIQKLTLQGRWNDLINFLSNFKSIKTVSDKYNNLLYHIYKQQYLEAISWFGDGGHRHALLPWKPTKLSINESELYDTEQLLNLLKNLENLCTRQEFDQFCQYLTLDKLSDSPIYCNWTVSQGRLETLQSIRLILSSVYPYSKQDNKIGLFTILSMALSNQKGNGDLLPSKKAIWDSKENIPTICNNYNGVLPNIEIVNPILNKLYHDNSSDVLFSNVTPNEFQNTVESLESNDESKEFQENLPKSVFNHDLIKEESEEIESKQRKSSKSPKQKNAAVSWTVEVAPNVPSRRPSEPTVSPTNRPRSRPNSQPRGSRPGITITQLGNDENTSVMSKISKDSQNTTSNKQPSKNPPPLPIAIKQKVHNVTSPWELDGIPRMDTIYQSINLSPLRCVKVLFRHNPNECTIAVGTNNKSVNILKVPILTNDSISNDMIEIVNEYEDVHRGSVYSMDYNHNAGLLLTASNDKSVKIYNVSSKTWSMPMKGHNGTIRVIRCRNSAIDQARGVNLVASGGGGDCITRLWDINKGIHFQSLTAHEDMIHGLLWIDENTLLSGCDKGVVICHDIRTTQKVWSSQLSEGICTLSRYSDNLSVIGCTNGSLSLIDLTSGKVSLTEKLHHDDIRSTAIIPQGSQLPLIVTTSFDGTAAIWKKDNVLTKFINISILSGGHTDKVLDVSVIPGGEQHLLTSGADGKVLLWRPTKN